MKEEGADVHDIKHAENVLEESKIMIPDTRQRLEGALQDLTSYLANVEPQVSGIEELKAAKSAIDNAQAALS
ncbi:g7923 [Coccomyxa viridis]|uniref:Tubulin-specific chaperone A n=1 Tax=Coccomyxa viridis TaxID=1274662 RepID=A0ABP1FZ26_9CHLO